MNSTRSAIASTSCKMWVESRIVLFGRAADRFADFVDLVRVEPGRRLVEDQHVGLVQQHLGHADPLAIAAREFADRFAHHAPTAHSSTTSSIRRAVATGTDPGVGEETRAGSGASCRYRAAHFRAGSPSRADPANRLADMSYPAIGPRPPTGPDSRSAAASSYSCRPRLARETPRLRPGGFQK